MDDRGHQLEQVLQDIGAHPNDISMNQYQDLLYNVLYFHADLPVIDVVGLYLSYQDPESNPTYPRLIHNIMRIKRGDPIE